jgi:hypothetical protein
VRPRICVTHAAHGVHFNGDAGCQWREFESAGSVIIRRDDLLHCLQVAVWRAGLLGQPTLLRLKEALGIGVDESVPKPGPR